MKGTVPYSISILLSVKSWLSERRAGLSLFLEFLHVDEKEPGVGEKSRYTGEKAR